MIFLSLNVSLSLGLFKLVSGFVKTCFKFIWNQQVQTTLNWVSIDCNLDSFENVLSLLALALGWSIVFEHVAIFGITYFNFITSVLCTDITAMDMSKRYERLEHSHSLLYTVYERVLHNLENNCEWKGRIFEKFIINLYILLYLKIYYLSS